MKLPEKEVPYVPLQNGKDAKDHRFDVYSITDASLPFHMRTLLPAPGQTLEAVVSLERTRRRLRCVLVCLAVCVSLFVLTATVLVVVYQLPASSPTRPPTRHLSDVLNDTTNLEIQVEKLDSEKQEGEASYSVMSTRSRTPCIGECWPYSAFRFKSVCYHGYCTCRGANYNPLTCLPSVAGCDIHSDGMEGPGQPWWRGDLQVSFSCLPKLKNSSAPSSLSPETPPPSPSALPTTSLAPSSPSIHVISVFGHVHSPSTVVKLQGRPLLPVKLVLVNYLPMEWQLDAPPELSVEKVYVVSFNNLSKTRLSWLRLPVGGEPPVTRLFSKTGYGDDRHGGHTPDLLMNIQRLIGDVSSFSGARHADTWSVDLSKF